MTAWVFPLQSLINQALLYDIGAQHRLKALVGKAFVLKVSEPTLVVSLIIESEQFILVDSAQTNPCDAMVSGKARDLFAVLRAQDRTAAMMAHEITIAGDTRTFFALQEVMAHLNIDWEMALGDRIGDLAAHLIADGVRFFGHIARNQLKSLQRTGRNFLREESRWLVQDSLWRAHRQSIQQAGHEVDRLAAKMRRLSEQLKAKRVNDQGDERE